DQVQGNENQSTAYHADDQHQHSGECPVDAEVNGCLGHQCQTDQEITHPVLAKSVCQQVKQRVDRADKETFEPTGADVAAPQCPQVIREHVIDGLRQGNKAIDQQNFVIHPAVEGWHFLHYHPN